VLGRAPRPDDLIIPPSQVLEVQALQRHVRARPLGVHQLPVGQWSLRRLRQPRAVQLLLERLLVERLGNLADRGAVVAIRTRMRLLLFVLLLAACHDANEPDLAQRQRRARAGLGVRPERAHSEAAITFVQRFNSAPELACTFTSSCPTVLYIREGPDLDARPRFVQIDASTFDEVVSLLDEIGRPQNGTQIAYPTCVFWG
jgi:hypothetical protein